MSDYIRCNKVSGVYWLKKPLVEINITIKIKAQDGNISLPTYEDYADLSRGDHVQNDGNTIQEYHVKWQQKVFSKWELQRYSDLNNCLTENEISYHNLIKNTDVPAGKVFTYIHEDNVATRLRKIKKEKSILNLESCMATLNLHEKFGGNVGDGNSVAHLFRSEENVAVDEEQWICMHVVFDNSEYNEDSKLLMKQEAILLSLYHNPTQNSLIVTPDTNNIDLNAYTIESNTGVPWGYQYGVGIGFENGDCDELKMMLEKFYSRWEKNHKQVVSFTGAPLGKKQYYVVLDIVSAKDFDMDDLYIEYNVKIPESIKCDGSLHGRTHVSRSMDVQEWCFGHIVELNLEMDADLDPPPLQIIFEAVSTDWWGRHRTEGYCYLPLTLRPGRFIKRLSCSRPGEMDEVTAESRRFFVGGCHLIKDLEVLTKPQLMESNYTFTSTGSITVRCDVTRARSAGAGAVTIMQDAAAALAHYTRARGILAAATREIDTSIDY